MSASLMLFVWKHGSQRLVFFRQLVSQRAAAVIPLADSQADIPLERWPSLTELFFFPLDCSDEINVDTSPPTRGQSKLKIGKVFERVVVL